MTAQIQGTFGHGWTWLRPALGVLIPALALFLLWRLAVGLYGAALLDRADALARGSGDTRVAVPLARYGSDPAQQVEVIVPAGPVARPVPVVVFFHGGGWRSGNPHQYGFVGRSLARAGYLVVLAGYRLGEAGRFPRMLEDSAAAVAWTRDHAARLGGDPEQIFAMGHSAGAYNAVMLALDPQWLARAGVPAGALKGVIGLAGPYDFHPFTTESAQLAFGAAPDSAATQPITFAASAAATATAPPLLLVHGTDDSVVKPRNSLELARRLSAGGRPQRAVLIDRAGHEDVITPFGWPFSRDRRVTDAVLAFLAAQGGAVPPASAPVQAAEH